MTRNTPKIHSSLKKIALFLISQNISLFGSTVVSFTIIWHITLMTSSGIWVTLFTICSLMPQVIVSPWAGVWADRYNRKFLIMAADGFIAVATLGLAVAYWLGYQNLELLLAVSVVRSFGAGIQLPAVNALLPQIVPPERLTRVQGVNQTLNSISMLLAPAVGGLLLGSTGIVGAFLLDVATAATAIAVLSLLHVERVVREAVTNVFAEIREGLVYSWDNDLIRRVLICYAVSFFFITPTAFLTPLFIERTFGDEIWRLTANEMVWMIASMIGGVFVTLHGEFKNKVATISLCLVAFGICFAMLGTAHHFSLYLAYMGLAGFFSPVITTAQTVMIQEHVESTMMGRVFSLLQIVSVTAMPIAILLFGPLADIVSIRLILIVSGGALALSGLLFHRANKSVVKPSST